MEEPGPKSSPFARMDTWRAIAPFLSIGVLALFGTGLLVKSKLPSTARPPESLPSLVRTDSEQVDLRLWQDPFAAVEEDWNLDHEEGGTANGKSGTDARHSIESLTAAVTRLLEKSGSGRLLVLPVAVPSTWYQRDREERRRARFAVCAALEAAAFIPEDAAHIRYCAFTQEPARPTLLPFEVFRSDASAPNASAVDVDHVVVMWVRDSDLVRLTPDTHTTMAALQLAIRQKLSEPQRERAHFLVLGPRSSDTLDRLREVWSSHPEPELFWVAATPTKPLPQPQAASGGDPNVLRTSPYDDVVMAKLARELRLRRVDLAEDTIVLLCEFDSTYTRELHHLFAREMGAPGPPEAPGEASANARSRDAGSTPDPTDAADPTQPFDRPNLWKYSFLRGLEGEKRQDAKAGADPAEETQVDYVMALARKIRDKCDAQGWPPRALGIFGIDIFDKLLLLRVLRPMFPQTLFFTFDLDTLYLKPEEVPTTRNLLVASGFGFSTSPPDASGPVDHDRFPPMRGSSQSCIGYAAELILRTFASKQGFTGDKQLFDQVSAAAAITRPEPRIFEIGTRSEVDLDHPVPKIDANPASGIWGRAWRSIRASIWSSVIAILLAIPLLFILIASTGTWFAMLRETRTEAQEQPAQERWRAATSLFVRFVLPFFAVNLVVLGLAWYDGRSGRGEPFFLWNGVSVWPTIFLYSWSGFLALTFFHRTRLRLEEARRRIRGTVERLVHSGAPSPIAATLTRFLEQVEPGKIRPRVIGLLLTNYGLAALFFYVWGLPGKPTRGPISYAALIGGIFVAVVTLHLLLFFILTVTRQALLACRSLRAQVDSFGPNRSGMAEDDDGDDDLGDEVRGTIDAVSALSSSLEPIICGPFLSLALMVIARSTGFDRYDWPLSLVLTMSLAAGLALVNAHCLGRAVREVRRAATTYLDQWLERNAALSKSKAFRGHRALRADLADQMRSGPLGWISWPTVEAVLLSFGGVWALQYMEILSSRV